MRRIAAQVMIVVVIAVIGYGVHKGDEHTQAKVSAQARRAAALAYRLCEVRNEGIVLSNKRWDKMRSFLSQAAVIRSAQAHDDPPKLARIDLLYAETWQQYADEIQPTPIAQCGDAP